MTAESRARREPDRRDRVVRVEQARRSATGTVLTWLGWARECIATAGRRIAG